MFASKGSINKIYKIHFIILKIVYNAHEKLYEEVLAVSNDIFVHQKHLRILPIEFYKSLMKRNPDFIWDFCTIKPVPYDLRTGEKLYLPTINKPRYSLNSLIFRGNLLWNSLPTSIKISQSLLNFKNNLRHIVHCTFVVCR